MRKAWLLLLLAPSALVYACGGDDTSDGGTDAQGDNTTTQDGGGGDAAKDGNTIETSTLDSSSTDGGPDATVTVDCRRPSDCVDGGNPDAAYPPSSGVVCCGTLVLSGGGQNCNFDSFTTKCTAPGSCPSNIKLTCTTETVRGCAHTSECVENGYDKCCTVKNFDDASVCMSQTTATALNAPCLP